MKDNQPRHIYKKVESESIVNIDAMKQEIEADKLGSGNIDDNAINLYHEIITNKVEKGNIITLQMEQCYIKFFQYKFDSYLRNK